MGMVLWHSLYCWLYIKISNIRLGLLYSWTNSNCWAIKWYYPAVCSLYIDWNNALLVRACVRVWVCVCVLNAAFAWVSLSHFLWALCAGSGLSHFNGCVWWGPNYDIISTHLHTHSLSFSRQTEMDICIHGNQADRNHTPTHTHKNTHICVYF